MNSDDVVEVVRKRYGSIASAGTTGCCADGGAVSRSLGYGEDDLASLPEGVDLSLGCGAPLRFLDLAPGETVLDLGSGAGIDCLIASRQVGPGGRVVGIDMTPEMLARAREAAERAGASNVEYRHGRLEALPVDDGSVDAVTSNCVINLVPDKSAVFREVARVLRPGGRMVISDIVLDRDLPVPLAESVLAWVGCVAGAMRREAYLGMIAQAGLSDVEVLRDVDYLDSVGFEALPGEVRESLARAGIGPDDLRGVVRSLTYRARRPA